MSRAVSNVLGMAGALAGGAIGFAAFWWIAGQGFYAPFLVGGLAGLGCMALSRHPSWGRGIACGVLALVMEVLAEWRVFPFAADESLGFLLAHLHEKPPIKLILMAIGALMATWLGRDHLGTPLPQAIARPEPGPKTG